MSDNGIVHVTIAPYHPSSNGLAERAVQAFKNGIKRHIWCNYSGETFKVLIHLSYYTSDYNWSCPSITSYGTSSQIPYGQTFSRLVSAWQHSTDHWFTLIPCGVTVRSGGPPSCRRSSKTRRPYAIASTPNFLTYIYIYG